MSNQSSEHMGYYLYLDSKGKVVGVGQEIKTTIATPDPRVKVIESSVSGVGSIGVNKLQVEQGLVDTINDPQVKLSLRDLVVDRGKVKKVKDKKLVDL